MKHTGAFLLATVGLFGCSNSSSTGDRDAGAAAGTGGARTTGTGGVVGGDGDATAGIGGRVGSDGGTGSGGTGAGSGGRDGGMAGTGGNPATGGRTGAGGATGTGGAGGSGAACKRGIAANTAPGAAFSPAIGWWYDWSNQGAGSGVEFVPMIWGSTNVSATLPSAAKYLLTFNEPNFHAQSNLTAAQAAALWPTVQGKAAAAGLPIVSPGMNFCGPAASCNGTDPYQYLKDFFAACAGCQVDYVAVHWYNCDLPSLRDYLEPGGSLEGFEQFGKPIWLTEFSCDGTATAAAQETFMRAAVPYLEGNPKVFRYSWFSADPIPNGRLVNSDGSPTALGQVYIGLAGACH
jgi:hypothetical protein